MVLQDATINNNSHDCRFKYPFIQNPMFFLCKPSHFWHLLADYLLHLLVRGLKLKSLSFLCKMLNHQPLVFLRCCIVKNLAFICNEKKPVDIQLSAHDSFLKYSSSYKIRMNRFESHMT